MKIAYTLLLILIALAATFPNTHDVSVPIIFAIFGSIVGIEMKRQNHHQP